MSFLKTIKLEGAEGEIKDSYSLFLEQAGMIPKPMEMFSVSPELFKKRLDMTMYYRNHPKLDFSLLTCIRYAVASEFDSLPCVQFNGNLLRRQGLEESDLEKLRSDPTSAPLEEAEKAMLIFVPKALKSPESVTQEDIEGLHGMGWTDRDIFDAVNHGAITFVSSVMMRIFRIE
ncbi:MAG: hypothetical protein A2Y79_12160 [Deltaproteobacteria bacterium RBG_13_43_22]|nr:MAG: hypothetical protein A2Y79_12160 [Deltaproteobacteria bacterium RBG_13_43_22]